MFLRAASSVPATSILSLDSRIGTLRDRSVQWMLKAFDACNNTELHVTCRHGLCASSASRTSRSRPSPRAQPSRGSGSATITGDESDPSAVDQTLDDEADDTSVPTAEVIRAVVGEAVGSGVEETDGYLVPCTAAESDNPETVFGDPANSEPGTGSAGTDTELIVETLDSDSDSGAAGDAGDTDFKPGRAGLATPLTREPSSRARHTPGWYKNFDNWKL